MNFKTGNLNEFACHSCARPWWPLPNYTNIFIPICAAKWSTLEILIFVRKLPSNVFQNRVGRMPLYFLLWWIWKHFSSVQSLSCVRLFATSWTAGLLASLSITNSWSCSNSCPSSQWCHPAISSSMIPFSFFPQSLPASESFPMSQLFTWGGQSIRVSALA